MNKKTLEIPEMDKELMDFINKSWGQYCSACGTKKDDTNLKVLRKLGPTTQMVSECPHCGLKTMITVLPKIGMQINQIRSDLNTREFQNFIAPVTADDHLNFYNKVKTITNVSDLINFIGEKKK